MKAHSWTHFGNGSGAALPANVTIATINSNASDAQKDLFFKRACLEIIAKAIELMIDETSMKKLNLNRKNYTWTKLDGTNKLDGPTMLWCLLKLCNPNSNIPLDQRTKITESTTILKWNNKVDDVILAMQDAYNMMLEKGQQHDDYH